MLKSNHLKLSFDELKQWLSSSVKYDPPKGDVKQKELNLMMATVVLLKVFNDNPRRVADNIGGPLDRLNDALDTFNYEMAKDNSMELLKAAVKTGEKLCPIPTDTLKVILYALADLGLVNPPEDANQEAITQQILNCRAILYSFASQLGKKIEAKENPTIPPLPSDLA